MHIPDSFILTMGDDGCTAVKIYCEEELREEIAARFTQVFNEKYEELMDLIEEEENGCYEKEEGLNPFKGARITDYGVFLPFNALSMYGDGWGDNISFHDAGEAMEAALKIIKREYPWIRYEGYVAYCWSDVHGGDICQYEISSEKKKDKSDVIYDFVGEALGGIFKDEEALDELSVVLKCADEKEFKEIIMLFRAYYKWIPSAAIDKVIEVFKERDGDMTESLREFVDALRAST